MTPVKPQISKLQAERSCQVGFYERLLSESSRSFMLAFLSVFILLATVHIF
jgi:hypothetical protein